jgi:hypothetical protein
MKSQNKKNCRMLRVGALSTALVFAALLSACELDGGDPGPEHPTAAVDYTDSDPGKAVFINFSGPDVVTSLPHDFFDIAMYSIGSGRNSVVHIIANSGSYGTGVQVLKTDTTDISADLSDQKDAVTGWTFREGAEVYGRQGSVNPLSGASSDTTKNVYLIKVKYGGAEASYYKVVFNSYGPDGKCMITVVPGAEAGETGKVPLEAGLSGIADGYGYIYFDLHGKGGPRVLNDGNALREDVTVALPKAVDWDLLCTRTDDYTSDDSHPIANRSSILLNTAKGVAVYTAQEKYLEEVLSIEGLTSSDVVDAIGWRWYETDNRGKYWMPDPPNTYVIKTAEGNYAKFLPGTFEGPNKEKFHMAFRYYYMADATGAFDK